MAGYAKGARGRWKGARKGAGTSYNSRGTQLSRKNRKRLFFGRKSGRYGSHTTSDKDNDNKPLAPDNFRKLGAKDSSFIDSSSIIYYPWSTVNPLYNETFNKPRGKTGRFPSLKLLCSRIVAENCSDLNGTMLESLSFPCVKMIWNHILVSHNDSLSVFVTFATSMLGLPQFRCHAPMIQSTNSVINLRQDYLSNCLIPNTRNHRIENIFSNTSIDYLTRYLNGLKLLNVTFLDFSQTPNLLNKEDFLMVFKVKSLAGLDLSNNLVIDDNIISYLVMAIRTEMLPNLRVLRLTNCTKLSKTSIETLLQVSAAPKSSLSLIICDDWFPVSFHERLENNTADKYGLLIAGTNWFNYSHEWDHAKLLMKFPLAFQHHYLMTQLKPRLPNPPDSIENTILLDMMFFDQHFGFDSNYYMLDYVLRIRLASRNRFLANECCLLVDSNMGISPKAVTQSPPKVSEGIFTTVNTTKKANAKPRLKPKRKNVNVNDYF